MERLVGRLVRLPGRPGLLRVTGISTLGSLVAVSGIDPDSIRVDPNGEEQADAVVVVLDVTDLLSVA